MRVEVVDTVRRFNGLELDWTLLYQRDPEAHFFLSWVFLERVVREVRDRMKILVVWSEDDRCVAVWPLRVKTRWSPEANVLRNELAMISRYHWADFTGFLCDPDCEDKAIDALAEQVLAMDWGRLMLSYMRIGSKRLKRLRAAFPDDSFTQTHQERLINGGQVDNLVAPYVDLADSFEGYLQEKLSANRRQKLRRLLRHLDSDDDLRVTRSIPENHSRDLSILTGLWRTMYARSKGDVTEELAETYGDIVKAGLKTGTVYLPVLWKRDMPIAAQACFVDPIKKDLLFFVSGRNNAVTDPPAGLMLHAHTIRWAIANGLQRYEFLQGNEEYKYGFGCVDRQLVDIVIATRSGSNHSGRLDPVCRPDVASRIRQYAREGRRADARAIAAQAKEIWPDMTAVQEIDRLVS